MCNVFLYLTILENRFLHFILSLALMYYFSFYCAARKSLISLAYPADINNIHHIKKYNIILCVHRTGKGLKNFEQKCRG